MWLVGSEVLTEEASWLGLEQILDMSADDWAAAAANIAAAAAAEEDEEEEEQEQEEEEEEEGDGEGDEGNAVECRPVH